MAAARQNEINVSMAVVATSTRGSELERDASLLSWSGGFSILGEVDL
jgi:hypothetical protein